MEQYPLPDFLRDPSLFGLSVIFTGRSAASGNDQLKVESNKSSQSMATGKLFRTYVIVMYSFLTLHLEVHLRLRE